MKIRPVGGELFHVDGRTDMKLIIALRTFANAPKNLVTKQVVTLHLNVRREFQYLRHDDADVISFTRNDFIDTSIRT
jgi:hypothetical protein